jgi:hypothetical protein
MVQVLRDHPEVSGLRVEGHTDDQGRARRNLTLSQDRAAAVVTYLVSHGVAGSRLSSAGFGATRPAVPGRGEEARAQPPRGLHHRGWPRRGARHPGARGALAFALALAPPPSSLTPMGSSARGREPRAAQRHPREDRRANNALEPPSRCPRVARP